MNLNWYQTLNRPPLTPPNWIFGPVWTILYLMIAVSLILFLKNYKEKKKGLHVLIGLHLISNFIWTSLFFGLQSPGLALIDIIFLDVSLIIIILKFLKLYKPSAYLLCPYLVWVLFATYLNVGFLYLN
ncbi:MAG: TspO/MBR family protein [Planctomycetota bacterium]|jgi:tryptophan-rich sensory protein